MVVGYPGIDRNCLLVITHGGTMPLIGGRDEAVPEQGIIILGIGFEHFDTDVLNAGEFAGGKQICDIVQGRVTGRLWRRGETI